MTDRCEIGGCRAEAALSYLDHGVCDGHWNEFTAEDQPRDALRMALGIDAEAAAKETAMTETTTETIEAKADVKPARSKKTKAPRTAKAKATKTKATKPPKEKKPRPPKETLCVFACRVAEVERVAFHEATGPAGASRFARKLMVVFAAEDEAGFRALLKEARELRS